MVRPRRIKFRDPEDGAYHIISRALQKEYRFKEEEKQKFLSLLRWLSSVYFVRVATFSLMTTHIHLVIKMIRKEDISEQELQRRFDLYYNRYASEDTKKVLRPEHIPAYYKRFSDVSRFMQDLKQRFSRWYNERHSGYGHVWAERFKSVLLVGAQALRVCMLYVELNAVRAGILREPEKYRYCGLYHYLNGGLKGSWLDLRLLKEAIESYDSAMQGMLTPTSDKNLITRYVALVYQEGFNLRAGKASIPESVWADKMAALPEEVRSSIYMSQVPLITQGIIIGSKEDVEALFEANKPHFRTERSRKARPLLKQKQNEEAGSPSGDQGPPKRSVLQRLSLKGLFTIRSSSIS